MTPALGFAEDEPCDGLPEVFDPSIKLGGWNAWRGYGMPSMEVVLRGIEHDDFAGEIGGNQVWADLDHYTASWFQRWLAGGIFQTGALLTETLNGRPNRARR